jgi:hypothetical protein
MADFEHDYVVKGNIRTNVEYRLSEGSLGCSNYRVYSEKLDVAAQLYSD